MPSVQAGLRELVDLFDQAISGIQSDLTYFG